MATLGNTTVGTSNTGRGQDLIEVSKFTLSQAGVVGSMSWYGNTQTVAVNMRCCLYADTSGSAGALMGSTSEVSINSVTPQWWNFTGPTVTLNSGTYWLGFNQSGTASVDFYFNDVVAQARTKTATYPGFTDPLGAQGTADHDLSIYATYNPAQRIYRKDLVKICH